MAAGDSAFQETGKNGNVTIELPEENGDRNYTFQVTAFIDKTGEGREKIRQDLLFTFVLKCEYNLDLDLELTWQPNDSNVRMIVCGPDKTESFSVKNYDLTERVFGYSVQLTGSLAEDAQIISAEESCIKQQDSKAIRDIEAASSRMPSPPTIIITRVTTKISRINGILHSFSSRFQNRICLTLNPSLGSRNA